MFIFQLSTNWKQMLQGVDSKHITYTNSDLDVFHDTVKIKVSFCWNILA